MAVIRTYNSLNPMCGDFGYGWTWALNDMQIRLDETREDFVYLDGDTFSMRSGGGRDITLTLPDGHRTTFTYYLDQPVDDQFWAEAKWQSAPGVTATLSTPFPGDAQSPGDNSLNTVPGFKPYWQYGHPLLPMDNFDMERFVLRTQDGTQYIIKREDLGLHFLDDQDYTLQAWGKPYLYQIIERNGETTTIESGKIIHRDAGGNITRQFVFQRNDQGLITALYDPNSGVTNAQYATGYPLVIYQYEANTNLMSVSNLVDRAHGTYAGTSFTYTNSAFPHYITGIIDPRGVQAARNIYDDSGKLIGVTDSAGRTTWFSHDVGSRVETVQDRQGNSTTYGYDTRGNVTTVIDALQQVTQHTYDLSNNVTADIDALTNTTSYAYDSAGNRIGITNALNQITVFNYSANNDLLRQTDPLGNSTTNGYDGSGNLTHTAHLDTNNVVIEQSFSVYENGRLAQTLNGESQTTATFAYDDSGNMTKSTDARGFAHGFIYDSNGNQIGTSNFVNGVSVTTSTEYDVQGRVIRAVDALGNTNQTFYNPAGKVDFTIDKLGNTNSFLYDSQGNLIQTTYPDGLVTRTVFDENGRAILTTDRNGVTGTLTVYDLVGRVTSTVRLMNVRIDIVSDPNNPGQMMSVIGSQGTGFSTNSTAYFPNGWVQSRTGPDGQTTSYTYYDDGQTKTVTDPLTNVTTYAYDDAGRQKSITDARTNTTQFVTDAVGRNVKTIFADNSSITNIFNDLGQQIGKRDQANLLVSNVFNLSGQLIGVAMPSVPDPENGNNSTNPAWAYAFDQYGGQIGMTDAKGRTNGIVLDQFSRETARVLPSGQTNWIKYDKFSRVSDAYDFKLQRKQTRYDRLGRVATNFWFAAGASYPSNSTEYYYNTLGQLTNTIERAGTAASDTYTAGVDRPNHHFFARLPKLRPETAGATTGLSILALGMVFMARGMKRRRPGLLLPTCSRFIGVCYLLFRGRPTLSRSHSLTLPRSTSAPGRGEGNSLEISVYQRLLAVLSPFPPFPPVQKIRVHRCSSVVKLRFWRFATYWLIISLLGTDPRLDFWTLHAQTCTFPSNPSTDSVRVTYFAYDFDGHLTQVNSPEGVINYGYDLATGRLTSTCTANSYIAYDYDELGRLQHVIALKRNGAAINETTTYTYDKVGNRSTVTLPNGVVTSYAFDTLNRLTNLVHQAGTTNLATYTYALDLTGRRTNAVEVLRQEDGSYLSITQRWAFDQMYRLTNEVSLCSAAAYSYTNSYRYDQVGNRFSKTRVQSTGTTTTTNLFNANDQLLQEVSWSGSTMTESNAYAYDSNGSLLAKTNTSSSSATALYGYDLKNKLSNVTAAGSSVTNFFLYNDSGIRVQSWSSSGSDTTLYLVDANNRTGYAQVLEELIARGASPKTSYVIGDDVLAQGTEIAEKPSYFLHDGHGNTRQLSKWNGTISSHYNYDAYGIVQEAISSSTAEAAPTTKLYCGEQYDATLQMYNLRARYYSSANGRFNQRDSFEGAGFYPQTLHKYTYGNCDPANGIDPSGRFTLVELVAVVAILATLFTAVGCSHKAAPKVTKIIPVTQIGKWPDYVSGIRWGPIAGGPQLSTLGPYDDPKHVGEFKNVHWFVIEGEDLESATVERYVQRTVKSNYQVISTRGQGFQAPGAKVPNSLSTSDDQWDGPANHERQFLSSGPALVVADAPGLSGAVVHHEPVAGTDYPLEYDANFLLQVKYQHKILAEVYYDVQIHAKWDGPDGKLENEMKPTETKYYP